MVEELNDYVIENNDGNEEEYTRIKMDLRFSNQESSIPFKFQIDSKKQDFWKDFEKQFLKVSIKPTDYNFLKLFLIERELED